jgi:hypothetical protein
LCRQREREKKKKNATAAALQRVSQKYDVYLTFLLMEIALLYWITLCTYAAAMAATTALPDVAGIQSNIRTYLPTYLPSYEEEFPHSSSLSSFSTHSSHDDYLSGCCCCCLSLHGLMGSG